MLFVNILNSLKNNQITNTIVAKIVKIASDLIKSFVIHSA